jgi:hypothetical protein
MDNFTKGYRTIGRFEKKVLNFQTSQTRVSMFSNISIKGNLLGFAIKSWQNFQNTPCVYFLKKIYKKFQRFRHGYFFKFR